MKPAFILANNNLYLSPELAEKIITASDTSFSCGASKEKFRDGDFAYFGKATYTKLGCGIKYLCNLAIRRSAAFKDYPFVLAGVSGDFGFNFSWLLQRHIFSKRVKNQIFTQAQNIFTERKLA